MKPDDRDERLGAIFDRIVRDIDVSPARLPWRRFVSSVAREG